MAHSRAEGQRHGMLEKKRKKMMEEFEKQKEQISKDNQVRIGSDKFAAAVTDIDSKLKTSTVGLFELNDFRRIREDIEEQQRQEAARTATIGEGKIKKKKKKNTSKVKLSFAAEDEEEEEENDDKEIIKKPKFGKDPNVNTSFLPDREREELERIEREELRKQWLKRQEEIKDEDIEITYSYWDGSGHRKTVECKKGDTISRFLDLCRQQIHELRSVNVDNLLYIKEDLIIPHHYTFYDFIINKARGKSGPLFNFDVHDDVRLVHDATVEKDESHAGKVVERSWYEKNKHIFPASRWEVFDPEKNYGKYKIKDSKKPK